MTGCATAAKGWLRAAKSVAVLTGAGASAESGIPTFRGAGGLWRNYKPEDLATPGAFARDPKLVWEWYDWRREIVAKAQPNAGHYALAKLEQHKAAFTLATQNVDDLHERAGSKNIIHLHGEIFVERCLKCAKEYRHRKGPHVCECGGITRPGVVWFGEGLPEAALKRAMDAMCSCDVALIVGTSAVVYPAASLIPLAKRCGAKVIEVNLEETPMSGIVDCSLKGKGGEILPTLL